MEEFEKIYNTGWSNWKSFPDPRKGDYLIAPLGSGVYQLRNTKCDKYVLFGTGKHLAHRMSYYLSPLEQVHVIMRTNEDIF